MLVAIIFGHEIHSFIPKFGQNSHFIFNCTKGRGLLHWSIIFYNLFVQSLKYICACASAVPEVRNLVHFDALCWWWSTAEHVPRLVSGGSASRVHARLLSSYQETVQNIAAARKKVSTTVPFNWVHKGSIYQRLIVKIWAILWEPHLLDFRNN